MRVYSVQSMLLSKALQMQQDLEDKKIEIIIEGLESKIKEYEASLEKKDFLIQAVEGSLAEAQSENIRLNKELLQKSESFEQERKNLQAKYEAEAVENTKLKQSLEELRNMCLEFGSRCVQQLKKVFSLVGASAEKFTPLAENISSTFEHIEGEVEVLDEVIVGHGDFCALLASRGTAATFLKARCTHAKILNTPNFSLSVSNLIDIPNIARSIGSRFITQIWAKGGRELASDEARSLLKPVRYLYLLLALL
jgi:predicted RNase H-like nuclease (RuvC/YqgF family)